MKTPAITSPKIDRREILRLLGCTLGAGLLSPCAGTSGGVPFIENPEMVRMIGEAYLVLHPEEDEAELLNVRPDELDLEALREASRRDYAAGRTFQIAGWILSQTEGRLCTLAILF